MRHLAINSSVINGGIARRANAGMQIARHKYYISTIDCPIGTKFETVSEVNIYNF